MFIGQSIIVIVEGKKANLMSLAILFHFLSAQHFSDINISNIRRLRLFFCVELPHWSYCSCFDVCWSFGVVRLECYPFYRLKHSFSLQHSTVKRDVTSMKYGK